MKVIIIRGISGAGKSTFVKKLVDFYQQSTIDIFSADDFRLNDAGEYDFAGKPNAHQDCYSAFMNCITARSNAPNNLRNDILIVDNTNIRAYEIAPYIAIARFYGSTVEILRLSCPVELAIARNKHGVPADVIRKMVDGFENLPSHWPEELSVPVDY